MTDKFLIQIQLITLYENNLIKFEIYKKSMELREFTLKNKIQINNLKFQFENLKQLTILIQNER